jgi:hypothetical protein
VANPRWIKDKSSLKTPNEFAKIKVNQGKSSFFMGVAR